MSPDQVILNHVISIATVLLATFTSTYVYMVDIETHFIWYQYLNNVIYIPSFAFNALVYQLPYHIRIQRVNANENYSNRRTENEDILTRRIDAKPFERRIQRRLKRRSTAGKFEFALLEP